MYYLTRYAYCGMRVPVGTFECRDDARRAAARALGQFRAEGFPVVTLDRGECWEVCEPDDAVMVPDACGTIVLRRESFECRECGFDHDTRDDAAACCAESFNYCEE